VYARFAALAVALAGCGPSLPTCDAPTDVFASGAGGVLTCQESRVIEEATALLKGHPVPRVPREAIEARVIEGFASNPAGLRARLAAASELVASLRSARDAEAAELRSRLTWEVTAGEHPMVRDDASLRTAVASAVSVWTRDDAERLVLTESDIEGWVRYGSLCGEAQQRPPLKVSVADRVGVYSDEKDRFLKADRATKVAILTVGAFWTTVHDAWPSVSYEQQQRWTSVAIFPPPMEATSLAYLDALLETDPRSHSAAIIAGFGPLSLGPAPEVTR
jgi:hypothetical protein